MSLTSGLRLMRFGRLAFIGALLLSLGQAAVAQTSLYDWVVNVRNDGPVPVPAGSVAGYVVTVFNDALGPAPATTIEIAVPNTTTFVSASGSITGCAEVSGLVTCTVPPLGPDEEVVLNIGFLTTSEGVISVTPTIPDTDADTTNNSQTITTTITKGADISLALTGTTTVPAGGPVSYTFSATNDGPYASTGFVLQVPMPTSVGNVVLPPGCVLLGSTANCTVSQTVPVGGKLDFTFTGIAAVGANSTITVSGSVSEGTPPDPDASNDTALFDTAVTAGSDVSLRKTRSPSGSLLVGGIVTFTLAPSYTGDVPTGLTLTDTLPNNYRVVSVTPASGSGWTCGTSGQEVSCTKASGTVPGAGVSLGNVVVVAEVVGAGAATNTANVIAASPFDPNLSNNTADDGGVIIEAPRIDLAIAKSGPQPPLVVVGNSYDYTLGGSNLGNAPYYGTVRIEDFVPTGLTVTAVGGTGWTCQPAPDQVGPVTITCEIVYTSASPLPAGGKTPDITLTATVTQDGPISNGARISGIGGNLPDLNPGNDTTNSNVGGSQPGNSADIRLVKTAVNPIVAAGQEQIYAIEVINDGPAVSLDLALTDALNSLANNATSGAGAGYGGIVTVPGLAEGVACSVAVTGPQSVLQTCTIDRLPVCTSGSDCPTFEITVRPGVNGGPRSNTALIGSQTTADPNTANNSSTATFTVEARADVIVTKTATPSPVPAGQVVVYVLTAKNLKDGLSAAENVTVTDTLPTDVTFLSAVPSTGSCATKPATGSVTGPGNDTLVCNVGTLADDSQQTVIVTVRPNQSNYGNSVTNSVIVSTTTTETDTTNNDASVTTPVTAPVFDLLIGKVDSVDPVTVGEDTVYTLRAVNRGPSAAENVVVVDTLPTSLLSYQSFSAPTDASCLVAATPNVIGGSITCTFPVLSAQEAREIKVTLRGESKGVTVNAASVAADGSASFDSEPGNNATSQNTTVRTRADVAVTSKVPSNATPALGQALSYVVRVENLVGPLLSEADLVVLTDNLPAGMILTGTPTAVVVAGTATKQACSGAAGATSFTCEFGTFSTGGIIDVTVPVRVDTITTSPQTLTNTASVTTSSLDVNTSNNSNSGAVEVSASTLAGQVFRDFNDNGVFDANDTGIGSIQMTLTGTDLNGKTVNKSVNTASNGSYTFTLLAQGLYTVTQGTISEPWLDARPAIPGTSLGTSDGATVISSISLPSLTNATGYLFPKVPQARIGIAKAVSSTPVVAADGSFSVAFQFNLRNFSLEPLQSVSVTDQLAGASPLFGTLDSSGPLSVGSYRVTASGGSCTGRNASFDGSGDQVLVSGLTLAPNAACTVTLTLQVQPTVPLPVAISANVRYRNQATITGTGEWTGQTPASNPQLTDPSTDGTNPDPNGNGIANETGENVPTPVTVPFAPAITLVKTADASAIGDPELGDLITYSFTIRNAGNVTLTNVSLTDPLTGIVISGGPIPVLLPGASDSTTFTASYALTQADLNAGKVQNQATTTGTWGVNGSGGDLTVQDLSGTDATNDTPTVVNLGAIDLLKSVDLSAVTVPPAVGDTVSFSFTVTNTGPTNLRNVVVTDPLPGLDLTGSPIPSLAPGATNSTAFTATYTLTQADIDAGVLTNTATVTGDYATDGSGGVLRATDTSSTTSSLTGDPSVALVKTADASAVTTPALPGQVIT
ncbi:MAG: hypothetical protein NTX73_13585, partial [Rhodobacterales bacterium]|nr:hypothetical protein [Rhodobacterales bacterium]